VGRARTEAGRVKRDDIRLNILDYVLAKGDGVETLVTGK
jgi:hypothetical protein